MRLKNNIILGLIISSISGIASIGFSYIVKLVVDLATNNSKYSFGLIVVITTVLLLLMIIIDFIREVVIASVIKKYNYFTKNRLFDAFFKKNNKETDYISVLNNDISTIESEYISAGFDLMMYISMFLISTGILFVYNWIHGVVILMLAILTVLYSYVMRNVPTSHSGILRSYVGS